MTTKRRLFAWMLTSALSFCSMRVIAGDQNQGTETDPAKIQITDTVTVTATLGERELFETPRAVNLITNKEYRRTSATTALDALRHEIGIWTEIKTATTSDPIMRGLSGANILALIDGDTVTTLWGEGGLATDDLYGKIDSEWIERIEVLRGPSSVLYGSNSLGGVIHFITRSSPINYTDGKFRIGTQGRLGYGSAAREGRYRLEAFGANDKLKFLIGASRRDIGDYKGAKDQGRLIPTSGKDMNWDMKLEYQPSLRQFFTFTFQDTDRDNIHRYYRPKQDNSNDRHAAAVTYANDNPARWLDTIELSLYYQNKTDKRRDFANTKSGVAVTETIQGRAIARKKLGDHGLTGGFQYERDNGESPDDEQFTWTDWETQAIRKDAPDSTWQNFGLFLQDEWRIHRRWDLILSGRFDGFDFRSYPDSLYQPSPGQTRDLDRIHSRKGSLTGGIGVLYRLSDQWHLFSNFSRGFRQFAPKFGITQQAWGIQVPNPLPDPTTSLSWEMGAKTRSRYVASETTLFYTHFDGFPVPVPASFQGSDWYDYNGDGIRGADENTYQNRSSASAYIYGVEIDATLKLEALSPALGPQWGLRGGFSYNHAQDTTNKEPFRHGTPTRAIVALKWDGEFRGKPWAEITAEMAGRWDRIPKDRLNNDPGYRVNPQDMSSPLVRPYGLPGYTEFSVRGGVSLGNHYDLTLAVHNLADKSFRRAHSRMDDPGRNFRATLSFRY